MKLRLTERNVAALKSSEGSADQWVYDTEVKGFAVRMRRGGKAYYFRWKLNGRDHKKRLFECSIGKLEEARREAAKLRKSLLLGDDPQAEVKRRKAGSLTVTDLANSTIEDLKHQGRSKSHIQACEGQLRLHIGPAIGNRLARDIKPKDIEELHRSLRSKPRTANLVRSTLSLMFKRALRDGLIEQDPTATVSRFEEKVRERHLSEEEVGKLMSALDSSRSKASADAVRLLLYTGSRPKELLSATWDQFDLDQGIWTKPSQHTKAKKAHRVELADQAVSLLRGMWERRDTSSSFLFPSEDSATGHQQSLKTFWKLVTKRAGLEGVKLYDIRKTFATKLLASGADLRTVMGLTGHTQPITLLKHYAHTVPGKQREALSNLFGDNRQ